MFKANYTPKTGGLPLPRRLPVAVRESLALSLCCDPLPLAWLGSMPISEVLVSTSACTSLEVNVHSDFKSTSGDANYACDQV